MEGKMRIRMSRCLALVVAASLPRAALACDDEGPWAELDLARGVKDRQPVDTAEPFVAGETAYAWTNVHDLPGGMVEHVWYRNGREIARHRMDIGGTRWRTWSRHRLSAGRYSVEIIADDQILARREIDVAATPPTAAR